MSNNQPYRRPDAQQPHLEEDEDPFNVEEYTDIPPIPTSLAARAQGSRPPSATAYRAGSAGAHRPTPAANVHADAGAGVNATPGVSFAPAGSRTQTPNAFARPPTARPPTARPPTVRPPTRAATAESFYGSQQAPGQHVDTSYVPPSQIESFQPPPAEGTGLHDAFLPRSDSVFNNEESYAPSLPQAQTSQPYPEASLLGRETPLSYRPPPAGAELNDPPLYNDDPYGRSGANSPYDDDYHYYEPGPDSYQPYRPSGDGRVTFDDANRSFEPFRPNGDGHVSFGNDENIPLEPYRTQHMPTTNGGYYAPPAQHHALGFGANEDSIYDDEIGFKPFPIVGDQYPINPPLDLSEDEYSDEDDEQLPMVPVHPPPVGSDDEELEEPTSKDSFADPEDPLIPPETQPKRKYSFKKIRLFKGNLVLDCPVSQKLLGQYPEPRTEREFTHMRYSAATCDPKDFMADNFTLRQTCYTVPRQTELFIVVTIYNEDEILLGRTLHGIFKNIKHLCSRTRSKTWGTEAWKKVVVCVVADGRTKINERAKALMAALGVYQDGFAKNFVGEKPVAAHIYEYTTMVNISKVDKTVKLTTEKCVPVQMIFCLKEKNQKKINSHRWFFQAFGPIINPKVCVLLDAGTQPGHDSIYHLWKAFDSDPSVGGACGEIRAMLGTGWKNVLNPLIAAQNFEYKMSNILDKPLESAFGFISVLPGAFSAYRFQALLNDVNGQGPLEKYFKGETLHSAGAGIFTANMYLAEDRILCFELVAKRGCDWLLRYVKSAHADTDVPDTLPELVMQRRRWLNGSFFAAVYAQVHFFSLWKSGHSIFRMFFFHVEFLYQLFSLLFSWFSIGNFFLVFRILTSSLADDGSGFAPGRILSIVFLWIYLACIVTIFVLSFGNRPKGTAAFYLLCVIFFAIVMAYLLFASIYITVKSVEYGICSNGGFNVKLLWNNPTFRDLIVSMLSTYALYIVSSLMFLQPWHLFTSSIQYLLMSPSYINVLNVYAFCNIHDISWGTKGDEGQKTDLGKAETTEHGDLKMDIPVDNERIDSSYHNEIAIIAEPEDKRKRAEAEKKAESANKDKDYYALFRSAVVLTWMFTNFIVIAVVLNTAGLGVTTTTSKRSFWPSPEKVELMKRACTEIAISSDTRSQIYLAVVLWSVAGLALIRFLGSSWYLLSRLMGR